MGGPGSRALLVASTNPGKVSELAALLGEQGVEVVGLSDVDPMPEPEEVRDTFAGNALDKARHYAALSGRTTLADDSGLEVDALDGAPGVRSARFSGASGPRAAVDRANNDKLLGLMAGRGDPADRRARFVCAVCVVAPDGAVLATAEGAVEGALLDAPRGDGGFGYDPLFVPDEGDGRSFGEMAAPEKRALSHRGRALDALAGALGALP